MIRGGRLGFGFFFWDNRDRFSLVVFLELIWDDGDKVSFFSDYIFCVIKVYFWL